jgi:dipeptidase D
MTVAEEVGLEGANAFDGSLLTGSTLINLDSEEDGVLTVGCAGSTDTWIRVDAPRDACSPEAVTLSVVAGGGLGGHSGVQIALGHANAIKVLGRVLREAHTAVPFRLVSLDGGKSRNAIPRDAVALCSVPRDEEAAFRAAVESATTVVRDAHAKTDPGATVAVEGSDAGADAWTEAGTATMLDVVALVPTGPLAMSPDFGGLVETSTSLGEVATEGGRLTLHSLSRSSNDAALPEVIAALDAAARLGGGTLEVKHNYNGWRPDMDSRVLAVSRAVYERLFGEPPVVSAIHAGLETAVIGTKVSGHLDMLAIGPQIEGPHSPDERVKIATVERFWKLLVAVVDDLSTETR